jgi:heat shock protein 4
VGPPAKTPEDGSKAKIKVRVKLNLHGIVGVESAQQIEEEEYEESAPKEAAKPNKVRQTCGDPCPQGGVAQPSAAS